MLNFTYIFFIGNELPGEENVSAEKKSVK